MIKGKQTFKSEENAKKKQIKIDLSSRSAETAGADAALVESWRVEIEALKSKKFHNIQEAVAVVAENVVSKLGLDGDQAKETRLFVEEILLTDPDLINSIKSALKIS